MAKIGKHARGNTNAYDVQRTVQMPQSGQASQTSQSGREAYEQAYRQAYSQGQQNARRQSNQQHQSSQQQQVGAYRQQPTRQQPIQWSSTAASAYQPYGQPTANSQAYEQWATNQYNREFDMNRGKKSGCRKAATVIGAVLLVLVLGVGIGAFAYLNHINSLIGLGKDKEDIEFALADQDGVKPYYVLLIGSDSREGVAGSDADWAGKNQGQADVMLLARVDEANKQVTLLSIPRDTPWQIDGNWTKLNNVYMTQGVGATISAVSELTGVPISHYAEIHMSEFMELVDVVGGITVDVETTISYHEALTNKPMTIQAGTQHLNGAQAEVWVRERNSYATAADMNRQSKVRTVVFEILKEIKKKPVWELPSIISECAACVTTDLSSTDLLSMLNAIGSNPTMYSGTGPYEGDENPHAGNLWLCYQDPDGWKRVMDVVVSGGDPSSVSYDDDVINVAGE